MTININSKRRVFFNRLAFITLVAVYVLIIVGGIVRSSGSGMGCPDWPKCFGQWVPPTDESQLPENYKVTYTEKRLQKNIKLAKYLNALGLEDKAKQVKEDEMVLVETDFNVFKTWTEYINRLVGAAIGLLVIATFVASVKFYSKKSILFWVALLVLILTGFQGWIGSLVVSTNLLPWMVTVHMLLTFFILAGLIYLVYKSQPEHQTIKWNGTTMVVLVLCMVTLVMQVVYGTQVREGIDEIALELDFAMREIWIGRLGGDFYFHRSFSWIILALHIWLVWLLIRSGEKKWGMALMIVILISILSGALMAYMAIPPVLQPVHLVLSCIAFGIQFYLMLIVRNGVKTQVVAN